MGSQNDEKKNDLRLLQAVIREEPGAWEEFVHRYTDTIYSLCSALFSGPEVELEYLNVLRQFRSDNFAALRAYNGRAALSTYLSVKLRDLLSRRLFELFEENRDRAWRAFEKFFNQRLNALKRQSDDLYQEICLRLVDRDCQRIVSYDGRGSFTAYIGRVIDNICLDIRRESEGRRRLPEAVQRLPDLEQEIYRQLYWKGCNEGDLPNVLRDKTGSSYQLERINWALMQLQKALKRRSPHAAEEDQRPREVSLTFTDGENAGEDREVGDFSYSPETLLQEAEREHSKQKEYSVLKEALSALPAELALYVRLRFQSERPKSPKEIARLMGRSEREIYHIRQRTIGVLRTALKEKGLEKNPNLSV